MKKLICMAAVSLFIMGSAFGQREVIEDIKTAMKTGSSKELGKLMYQSVDVTLNGNIQTYSRTQAEYVLRDFFKKHLPESFTIIHQGASKGGLHFAIGQYLSKSDTFRVFVRIKGLEGRYLIHEISIDKE